MKNLWEHTKLATLLWYNEGASYMAAAVSYYALFAIVPLLLLSVIISSWLYGNVYVVSSMDRWGSVLGTDMLLLLHTAVENLEVLAHGFVAPLLGVLFFSTMIIVFFNTFASGLHQIWGLPHHGFAGWVLKSYRSILFIGIFELYLICLLAVDWLVLNFIGSVPFLELFAFETVIFLGMTTILFSVAYKILPRTCPSLHSRIIGAFIASCLFLVAKWLVSAYIAFTPIPGLFGAAGLILALLIWVYVSTVIVYFGAAFAYVHNKGKLS